MTADKHACRRQHDGMRVICPHCRTIYQLHSAEPDAILVCHRCGTEFSLGEKPDGAAPFTPERMQDAQTPDMFASNAATQEQGPDDQAEQTHEEESSAFGNLEGAGAESDNEIDSAAEIVPAHERWDHASREEEDEASPAVSEEGHDAYPDEPSDELPGPPPRKRARIVPWLLGMLLLIAGTGFWLNHEAWVDNPWLRSVLINVGLDLDIRDKDWRVEPSSVSATWVKRSGGDSVLVITGEVHNLLQTDLLPPRIHFTLYARDNPDEIILERDLTITQPPLMQTIRQAPFMAPPPDITPIGALGKRGFVLVLEDLPQNAGNFALLAKAR